MCRARNAARRPWRRHAAIPGPAYIPTTHHLSARADIAPMTGQPALVQVRQPDPAKSMNPL
jgi:hypothetical protein